MYISLSFFDILFGFNGKELDSEGMGGGGSTYDYGFRIYNPSLGKFLSVNPLRKSYPWLTPYQYSSNCPITFVDLDGLEAVPTRPPGVSTVLKKPTLGTVVGNIQPNPTTPRQDSRVIGNNLLPQIGTQYAGSDGTSYQVTQINSLPQQVNLSFLDRTGNWVALTPAALPFIKDGYNHQVPLADLTPQDRATIQTNSFPGGLQGEQPPPNEATLQKNGNLVSMDASVSTTPPQSQVVGTEVLPCQQSTTQISEISSGNIPYNSTASGNGFSPRNPNNPLIGNLVTLLRSNPSNIITLQGTYGTNQPLTALSGSNYWPSGSSNGATVNNQQVGNGRANSLAQLLINAGANPSQVKIGPVIPNQSASVNFQVTTQQSQTQNVPCAPTNGN